MVRSVGWILVTDDPSDVATTQVVPGVAYGALQGTGGAANVEESDDGTTAATPTTGFAATGIIPVTINVQIPLTATVSVSNAIVGPNDMRGVLVLQNLSVAGTGGTAPTLYIGFNYPAIVGGSLGLLPGVGIWLDRSVPVDAIFVAWGTYTAPATIQGFVGSGSIITPD